MEIGNCQFMKWQNPKSRSSEIFECWEKVKNIQIFLLDVAKYEHVFMLIQRNHDIYNVEMNKLVTSVDKEQRRKKNLIKITSVIYCKL